MSTKATLAPKQAASPAKKYTKVGNTPSGEWIVKNNDTGEEKRASEFGDVTPENTLWT